MKIMFLELIKEIWQGKSLARALMHHEIKNKKINGKVIDIGGGNNPEYLSLFDKHNKVEITSVDLKQSENNKINLEVDSLPFGNSSVDTVLMFNILEHIYNYRHLMQEVARVLKQNGQVIGFVPFLVNYHPDPHDYFRFTRESLCMIFEEVGGNVIEIKELGRGSFAVNYNNIMLSIPRLVRVAIFPMYYYLDSIYLWLRPNITKRFPLGYMFIFRK